MNEERYLIDNNVLSHLSPEQRASGFFRTRCRIPAEVLHEAEGYPDAETLKDVESTGLPQACWGSYRWSWPPYRRTILRS